MSDTRRSTSGKLDPPALVQAVYSLGLAAFITLGATALVGVVLAWDARKSAAEPYKSHFDYQLRSFAGLFAGALVGAALIPVWGVGIFLLLVLAIWFAARMIVGLNRAMRGESQPDLKSWLI